MAASDTFPVDPDYGFEIGREANVLRGRVESAREFLRQQAAPRRGFALIFQRRPRADRDSIQEFWHKMAADFFTFADKDHDQPAGGRKYSVIFAGARAARVSGYETYDIRCELTEQVGAAMATYPSFDTGYASVNVLVAAAEDLGASGKLWIYAGYGYRVNGTFTTVYLDEVDTGGTNPNTIVPLGLHRVRVVGGAPSSLDFLI